MNKKELSSFSILISIVVGLFSGFMSTIFLYNFYYAQQLEMLQRQIQIMNDSLSNQQKQIEIMRQTLEKKVQLILTVVPAYDWEVSVTSNGTVELKNTILTISRTEPTEFKVYVSNVGSAVAHLLYFTLLSLFIFCQVAYQSALCMTFKILY